MLLKETVTIVNETQEALRAQNFDRTDCACGVAIMASVLVGKDPEARLMLAHTMLKLARELLDQDLSNAKPKPNLQ